MHSNTYPTHKLVVFVTIKTKGPQSRCAPPPHDYSDQLALYCVCPSSRIFSKFNLSRTTYNGRFITSVCMLPIYSATMPIAINTIPIKKVLATTTNASEVNISGLMKKRVTSIHTNNRPLIKVINTPKYPVNFNGSSENEVILLTASCHNFA